MDSLSWMKNYREPASVQKEKEKDKDKKKKKKKTEEASDDSDEDDDGNKMKKKEIEESYNNFSNWFDTLVKEEIKSMREEQTKNLE